MPEMFGGIFLITVLVTFGILMVAVKLGMLDSVVYKFGTQRSLITRAWALFLTIISVGIIMGLGLLVEAIAGINLDLIVGAFTGGLSDLFNSSIMPRIGIIIFTLIALYIANKIRKKITRIIRSKKYSKVGFRNFRNWKNYVRETEQSRRDGKRDDAYLDSLAEEFEYEWKSISRSGKAAQLTQMYRDIFDNEFALRQYERKRPHFWERYEHKKPKEKEHERHEQERQEQERQEQKRQEREEKPKQESTIDLSKYYRILGLKPNATKEKITERFRELTLKYHSDRGGSDDKLKEIIEAKEILLNNKKKK